MTLVGALGHDTRATVDATGGVGLGRWRLDWWVGADDRWRLPAEEVAIRQCLVEGMPVVRTALRVPSGDAIQHVFGTAWGSIVVEVENASPAAFALALVVSGARRVELDGSTVVVDGVPALATPRRPRRWAVQVGGSVRDTVVGGTAGDAAFGPVRDRRGRIEAAFLFPVAHRATLQATLLEGEGERAGRPIPSAPEVARGWLAQLERGMRVDLPDARAQAAVERSRAQAVLAAGMRSDAELLGALEGWGLDDEAARAWSRASLLDRRRARRRARAPQPVVQEWPDPAEAGDDPRFLREVRDLLAREVDDAVEIVRALPEPWRGANLEVRDVPLPTGRLSYAVRWHGPRPALLWEAPAGVVLRAPGLDPKWSTHDASGEALLAAPTT